MKLRLATLALVLSMAAPAWAGWDWSTPAKGAVIGGGLGLLAGGAYGSSTDSTGAGVLTGALVGAGLGAAGGAAVGAGVDAVAPRHRSFAPNYSYPYYDTSYNGAPYYGAPYNGGAYSGAPYYGNQYYADPNYGYPYSQGGYWGHRHKHKHHHHDFDDDDDDD